MTTTLALAIVFAALGWIALVVALVRLSHAREALASAQRVWSASRKRLGEDYDATIAEAKAATALARATLDLAERRIAALTLVDRPLLDRAVALTKEAADQAEVTGEWKRHQVYARLLDEFPETRKRDLAYAIELALR